MQGTRLVTAVVEDTTAHAGVDAIVDNTSEIDETVRILEKKYSNYSEIIFYQLKILEFDPKFKKIQKNQKHT